VTQELEKVNGMTCHHQLVGMIGRSDDHDFCDSAQNVLQLKGEGSWLDPFEDQLTMGLDNGESCWTEAKMHNR
jgi:hypothetical protein